MPCAGDASTACGGPDRLSVYQNSGAFVSTNPGPAGWTSKGCWQDSVSNRVLGYRANTQGGLSIQQCTTACYNAGDQIAGAEYAGECWCGASLNGGRPGLDSQCDMVCSGNSSEYCGGSNALNLYQLSAVAPTTTMSTTTTTTTTTTTSTTTTTIAGPPTCAATTLGSGQVYNGGFEQGLSYWSTSSNGGATGQALLYHDAPPFEGCGVLVVSAPGPGTSRRFSIMSGTTITPGQTRTVSFYVGRRSASGSPLQGASFYASVQGSSGGPVSGGTLIAAVCSGAECDTAGANGSVWKKYSFSFNSNARYTLSLKIQVSLGDGAPAVDGSDDVLIDGIQVS
ncbi:putative fungistatic metabolite [Cyphellophora attinorum]|uniref:Putative fungistatic metabolite n=1 Tax=Cyphellophora attinorum TaxID=1664694 RepID=A0A0N1H884_9EURO|nr:putative fungistatic metabolite [Phialophora attinorum]KPI43064.1 putative fungistatic metabolite [Phialophora attinorum]